MKQNQKKSKKKETKFKSKKNNELNLKKGGVSKDLNKKTKKKNNN